MVSVLRARGDDSPGRARPMRRAAPCLSVLALHAMLAALAAMPGSAPAQVSSGGNQNESGAPEPLTAAVVNVPDPYDGNSEFKIRIKFTRTIKMSYRTLEEHSFRVSGVRQLVPACPVRHEADGLERAAVPLAAARLVVSVGRDAVENPLARTGWGRLAIGES